MSEAAGDQFIVKGASDASGRDSFSGVHAPRYRPEKPRRYTYRTLRLSFAGLDYVMHVDGTIYERRPDGFRRVRNPLTLNAIHASVRQYAASHAVVRQ